LRLVIGVGNELRGDDGAGLETVRLLDDLDGHDGVAVRGYEGEGVGLLDLWSGADAVWIIDAVVAGGPAGTVHRYDATSEPLPTSMRNTSTHATSVGDGIELARTLGRLPAATVVYGIAGASFRTGDRPSSAVRAAAAEVAAAVRAEVRGAQPDP
jgi:hydrogenase maturation protease